MDGAARYDNFIIQLILTTMSYLLSDCSWHWPLYQDMYTPGLELLHASRYTPT
jgi:hypothetical protein